MVLKYLSLPDIRSLWQALPKVNGSILLYMVFGDIRIDDHLLREYPIQRNLDLYDFLTPATKITLDRVTEGHMGQLKILFLRNVSEITFRNMEIMNAHKYLPDTLTKLTLVDVTIEERLWKGWLKKISLDLKHLRLIRIKTNPTEHNHFEFGDSYESLETLEFRGMHTVAIDWPALQDSSTGHTLQSFYCDAPEFYGLEKLASLFPSLRSLTLHGRPTDPLSEFKQLEHLKILGRVDPLFRKEVEDLSRPIKSVEIQCYDYTPEDQPNLILNTLSDYCLRKLLDYLPQKDCFSLAKTDRGLYKLVTRNKYSCLTIDSSSSWIAGDDTFLRAIAPFVTDFRIERVGPNLLWLLPHCKKLTSLALTCEKVTVKVLAKLPRRLERFELTDPLGPGCTYEALLLKYLSHLQGLRELAVGPFFDPVPCLTTNRDSLVHFKVIWDSLDIGDVYDHVWEFIGSDGEMTKLTELTLEHSGEDRLRPAEEDFFSKILSRVGRKLLKLTVDFLAMEVSLDIDYSAMFNAEWLQDLQELTLNRRGTMRYEEVQALCSLKELRVLRITNCFRSDWQVMQIIRELPKLTELQVKFTGSKTSFSFDRDLKETLSKVGDRKVRFRGYWK